MLLAVLLIVGAIMVMFIGGLGIAEDVVYHSSLQTATDGAAVAAAETAESQQSLTATYYIRTCTTHRVWNGHAWVPKTHCSDGAPMESAPISELSAGLSRQFLGSAERRSPYERRTLAAMPLGWPPRTKAPRPAGRGRRPPRRRGSSCTPVPRRKTRSRRSSNGFRAR